MKILFICGSYPPEKCSNADTSAIMVDILNKKGLDVEVMSNIDWKLSNWRNIRKIIKKSQADIIYIQYPGMGYKFSITPQILSFLNRRRVIVTLHEVSQLHIIRKLSLLPFSFCKRIMFTNNFERNYFHKIYAWTKQNKTGKIPIGSNISTYLDLPLKDRNRNQIVYFGQIRPKKGIEEIIELAKLIKKNDLNYTVIIMGRTYEKFYDFYQEMLALTEDTNISWLIDVSEKRVSEILGSNVIAYLPFPDGASERRGSLFAALSHHMIVFTTKGGQSLQEMNNCVTYINTPVDFFNYLIQDYNINTLMTDEKNKNSNINAFMNQYSWDVIMNQYIEEFKKVRQ
ncbi:MAG: glycosyltransferase [Prevotella sp.]|jgi:glycosyltransferase involved in cell wall biosynthesis|nr:glycosyltransferase [Prevotella sp.]